MATNDALRTRRQECLLTQQELAHLVGMSASCIANLETGRRLGRWKTRKRVSQVLEASESELFPQAA